MFENSLINFTGPAGSLTSIVQLPNSSYFSRANGQSARAREKNIRESLLVAERFSMLREREHDPGETLAIVSQFFHRFSWNVIDLACREPSFIIIARRETRERGRRGWYGRKN